MLLGQSGRPFVELGGAAAWKTFTKGDIVASLQWLDLRSFGSPEDGLEPVLALFAAHRRVDTAAYVVPQRSAFQFANRDGSPTKHLLGSAFKAAVTMGFHPDKATVHRIIDVIVDAMPDLIRMASAAPADLEATLERPLYGIEATASVNGKVVKETVL